MNEELKKSVISKVEELLDKPLMDAKIQIDYHCDEIPTIRYDITECLSPKCLYPKARKHEKRNSNP